MKTQSAAKKHKKPAAKPVRKPKAKAKPSVATPSSDNPYRRGTMYNRLFEEGSKGYLEKGELIHKVAQACGKSERVVGFAYEVLKSKNHRSNKGRSTVLVDEQGRVKLIALHPRKV